MKWIKKGHIFTGKDYTTLMVSHAQCPTARVMQDRIRIYFSTRQEDQQSLLTFIDVDKHEPTNILQFHRTPLLEKGRRGTFDENGMIPSCLIEKDNKVYLYYAGWSQSKNVPYKNFTGLAISHDDGFTFQRYSEAPCFSMNEFDPLSATGPCIIKKNNQYFAIYSTGKNWFEIDGHFEHTYLLTYATSLDAIHWQPTGKIIVEPADEFEAYCLPAIIELGGLYHMWYSKRGSHNFRQSGQTSYRMGYAYSTDLVHWIKDDQNSGIDISKTGWDSEMICYPNIVQVDGQYIMFYNGNGFGQSGIGYAVLEY